LDHAGLHDAAARPESLGQALGALSAVYGTSKEAV
jgi:hypothetical protein